MNKAGHRLQSTGYRRLPLIAGAFLVVLGGCGDDRQTTVVSSSAQGSRPEWVGRRADVPFTPHVAGASDTTLAMSRQMDEIEALVNQGLYDQAHVRLGEYLAQGGTHPRAYFLQARLLYQQGKWNDAAPWFQQAVEKAPRWIEPRLLLAQCYLKAERLSSAEGVYEEFDRLFPKGPWGVYGMGLVERARGHLDRATTLLDEAINRDPHHGPSLWARAEIARAANQPLIEEHLIGRYLGEEPESAQAHFRLAELAAAAGHPQDARRFYERSYDLEPQATTARRLAELATSAGDARAAAQWQDRAGIAPAPEKPAVATP